MCAVKMVDMTATDLIAIFILVLPLLPPDAIRALAELIRAIRGQ